MQKKIQQYVELKKQMRVIEAQLKNLEGEIKDNISGKVEVDGFVLSKKNRITYTLKKDVDMSLIKAKYPGICKTTVGIDLTKLPQEALTIFKEKYTDAYYENISVEAKKLYEVAEDPKSLVDEKVTEYLEVKEQKEKEPDALDF